MKQVAFFLDVNRCTGCRTCEDSCPLDVIYMDEVGTPDSSRIWDGAQYREGEIVENSKEGFRQMLLKHLLLQRHGHRNFLVEAALPHSHAVAPAVV